jgi:hypothetical protein
VVTSSAEAWAERKIGARRASVAMTKDRRTMLKREYEGPLSLLFIAVNFVADLTIGRDSSASWRVKRFSES